MLPEHSCAAGQPFPWIFIIKAKLGLSSGAQTRSSSVTNPLYLPHRNPAEPIPAPQEALEKPLMLPACWHSPWQAGNLLPENLWNGPGSFQVSRFDPTAAPGVTSRSPLPWVYPSSPLSRLPTWIWRCHSHCPEFPKFGSFPKFALNSQSLEELWNSSAAPSPPLCFMFHFKAWSCCCFFFWFFLSFLSDFFF